MAAFLCLIETPTGLSHRLIASLAATMATVITSTLKLILTTKSRLTARGT
jgi:hypothetical protein